MKFGIYIYEGDFEAAELRENLMLEAVGAYCASHGIDCENIEVVRSEKGKPYICGAGTDVYCNVSHSGNMWICIVGEAECGIDLQQLTDCKYEQIGRRYFSKAEQSYISRHGLTGFFRLWVRREAYGKYTGEGFYGQKPELVDELGMLCDRVGDGYLKDLPIAQDVICTYCTAGEDDEIEIFI